MTKPRAYKKTLATAFFLTLAPLVLSQAPFRRSEAFFGLHFDLHPSDSDTALGADVIEDMVGRLLRRVKPDYVQYDCKGHAGWAGYPTSVGWAAPGIKADSLAVWRKMTRQAGAGLFIHYSGVWDNQAIAHHPEWARIDAQGKPDPNNTSVFGGYKDGLLIPQLKEVVAAYDLDGLWVDGECWAAQFDYSPAAVEAWKRETGKEAPKDKASPDWLAWKMFHRKAFETYLAYWVDALHAFRPGLQITSNWMYSSFAPKAVEAKLDYLSGDYSPSLSVDRARVEARYLASTGMPWDLMAWGFDKAQGQNWTIKPATQLMQEAAVVLMQGGGFQIYHTPTRTGFIHEAIVDQLGQVADFCRARQSVSFKSKTVPQVALLNSSESYWDASDRVFAAGAELSGLEGALHALLELGYSVDILAEHQLEPRMSKFPLIVVPDSHKLAGPFRDKLLAYVEEGGSLFLMGERSARLFKDVLGVEFKGEAKKISAELNTAAGPVNADGVWQDVGLQTAKQLGYRHPTRDTRIGAIPAASIIGHGRGLIAAAYGPLPNIFFRSHAPGLRAFIGEAVGLLFPEPKVRVVGPPVLDIALRTTADGKLSVHLLNRAGLPLPDRFNFSDYIPPVGPITVEIRTAKKPERIVLAPGNAELKWEWDGRTARIEVPKIGIHEVVVVH